MTAQISVAITLWGDPTTEGTNPEVPIAILFGKEERCKRFPCSAIRNLE